MVYGVRVSWDGVLHLRWWDWYDVRIWRSDAISFLSCFSFLLKSKDNEMTYNYHFSNFLGIFFAAWVPQWRACTPQCSGYLEGSSVSRWLNLLMLNWDGLVLTPGSAMSYFIWILAKLHSEPRLESLGCRDGGPYFPWYTVLHVGYWLWQWLWWRQWAERLDVMIEEEKGR